MAKELRHSASKITTYKGCPLAYFLKYIKHEIVAEDVRLSFGKVVHAMLDEFYKKNFKSDQSFANSFKFRWFRHCSGETLKGKKKEHFSVIEYPMKNGEPIKLGNHIRFYKPSVNESEDEIKQKTLGIFFNYMRMGEGLMKKFYNEWINRPDPILRESAFTLHIPGHPNQKGVRKKHLVIVVFDRIDEKDGHIIISDYKTDAGNPEDKAFSLHRHPQFSLYSLALRQLIEEKRISFPCGAKEESAIFYHHLRSGKLLPTYRSEIDHEYVRSLLDDVAEGIINRKFTPFYGFHCNMCDYQVPCEKWSVAHGGPRITLEEKIKAAKAIDWNEDFHKFLIRKQNGLLAPSDCLAQQGSYLLDNSGQSMLPFPEPAPVTPFFDPNYTQKRIKWKKPKKKAEEAQA